MGGSTIFFERYDIIPMFQIIDKYGVSVSSLPLFANLSFGNVLSTVFMVLIVTFFITSADSSTLALGMLITGGKQHPLTVNRITWGGLASLLIVVGGINALRSSAIITGFPFAVFSVITIVGMVQEFQHSRPMLTSEPSRATDSEQGTSARSATNTDDD